jgi:excisionase family DNA binding protein
MPQALSAEPGAFLLEKTEVGKSNVAINERLAVSIKEAAQIVGLGRTRLYELLKSGEIPSIRLGRRRLIKIEALREFVGRLDNGRV